MLDHKLRAKGIGSSEIAMLLGISKWGGPHALWRRKTDREQSKDSSIMARGRYIERAVLDWYEDENGTIIRDPGTKQHWLYPWVVDSVDAIRDDVCCVEAKTAHPSTHREWDDGVPMLYAAQCHWHCAVWGLPYCDVPVDFGHEFKLFRVDYDDALFERMAAIAGEFWDRHVLADVEPEPDPDHETSKWLSANRVQDGDDIRDATESEVELLLEYRDVKESMKRKDELEVKIKETIGADAGIRIAGTEAVVTHKENKNGRRVLRTKGLVRQ